MFGYIITMIKANVLIQPSLIFIQVLIKLRSRSKLSVGIALFIVTSL